MYVYVRSDMLINPNVDELRQVEALPSRFLLIGETTETGHVVLDSAREIELCHESHDQERAGPPFVQH